MGILGNIAENLLDMASDAIQNSVIKNSGIVKIVFDHTTMTGISTDIGDIILDEVGKLLNVKTNRNQGKAWDFHFGLEEGVGNAFVIKNESITVRYSVLISTLYEENIHYGIEILGQGAGDFSQRVFSMLRQLGCSNIQYIWDDLPFYHRYWINSVEPNLEEDTFDEDIKKFCKSQGLKKHGDVFIKGDLKDLVLLLNKWKEIFEKNSDVPKIATNLFDKDKLYFDEEMSNERNASIFTDGISAISHVNDCSNNILCYFKVQPKKSLIFQYIEEEDYSYMQLEFNDERIQDSLENVILVPEKMGLRGFERFLEELEDSDIEIPYDFYNYFNNFKNTLYDLEEALKSNERTDSIPNGSDEILYAISNAFEILELDVENATIADVKKSYRNLSKEYHPDKMQGLTPKMKEIAESKMQEINEAYDLLIKYFEN